MRWCAACRKADRDVGYCSEACQSADWAAHKAVCGTFSVGAAVVIKGLVSQTAHNGRRGRVIAALDVTTGRYAVELDEDKKRLSLKRANMRRAKLR